MDLIVAGHDHHLEDWGEEQGTRIIVSGAGAKVRKVIFPKHEWADSELGYVVLHYLNNKVYYEFKNTEGSVLHVGYFNAIGLR